MSPMDLGDSELAALLGRVPSPQAPAADLAERIVARSASTPQFQPSRFASSPRRRFRQHPVLWSAFIAANALAAAAAAASWDGGRFDFNRLADLPHRVAASIHLSRHHDHHHHHESRAPSHPSPNGSLKAASPKIVAHPAPPSAVPRAVLATPLLSLKAAPANPARTKMEQDRVRPMHRHEHTQDAGRAIVPRALELRLRKPGRQNGIAQTGRMNDHLAPAPKRRMSAGNGSRRSGERAIYSDGRWTGSTPQVDNRLGLVGRYARGQKWKFRQPRRTHLYGRRFRFNRRR